MGLSFFFFFIKRGKILLCINLHSSYRASVLDDYDDLIAACAVAIVRVMLMVVVAVSNQGLWAEHESK